MPPLPGFGARGGELAAQQRGASAGKAILRSGAFRLRTGIHHAYGTLDGFDLEVE